MASPLSTFGFSLFAASAWIAAMISRKPGVHLAVAVIAVLLNVVSLSTVAFAPPPD